MIRLNWSEYPFLIGRNINAIVPDAGTVPEEKLPVAQAGDWAVGGYSATRVPSGKTETNGMLMEVVINTIFDIWYTKDPEFNKEVEENCERSYRWKTATTFYLLYSR